MVTNKQSQHLSVLENIGFLGPKMKEGKDLITEVCHRIENLDENQARTFMHHCVEARGFNTFLLGGALSVIKNNVWHKEYGFDSFKSLVIDGLGMSTSAAYDYIKIYDSLIDAEVAWEQVQNIGWTKLRWIARYLNKGNVDQWVKLAEDMKTEDLRQKAKLLSKEMAQKALVPKFSGTVNVEESTFVDTAAANDGDIDGSAQPETVPLVSEEAALSTAQTKIFKLYPEQLELVDQALKMAMKDSDTGYQNVGLERICMHFLTTYQPDID